MSHPLYEYIAIRIRYLRNEQGWTQTYLSEKAGREPKYISKIENMKYNMKMETLEDIMNALKVTPEEFFGARFPDSDEQYEELTEKLSEFPYDKQKETIQLFLYLLNKMK
ncbi:helix-turn-helix domain-containing protein [Tetragenococcus halophilus]|uniref:helix-turn-helix domain-containing protein n=1 Tax=Tetragenococcus halophilus TaxID=51669 RepID=UPI0012FE55A2|nr:helix-turn-helix transcriptional regulator [Tetragenococcus halophilus]MCT8311247.1 helix-turn-helix transcriptional regulator [Tetragenococcus halophilus]